jgi:hypothetical protein
MTTFTHAGVSTLNGKTKVRFANDALRVKILAKNGHKDIDIVQLRHSMTKEDAVAYLMEIDFATRDGVTNPAVQAALDEAAGKRGVKAAPTMDKIVAKAKTVKAKAEPVAQVPADLADENIPF